MTAEMLSILAGSLLALMFAYVPGLAGWYERLGEGPDGPLPEAGTRKRLVMLACLAVTAAGSYGLACSGWGASLGLELECSQAGALELLRAFILALAANQATYLISPRANR